MLKRFVKPYNAKTYKIEMNYVTTLMEYGKWEKMSDYLDSIDSDSLEKIRFVPCDLKCNGNHSLLHLALKMQPPLSIIESLVDIFPEAINEIDCMKRLPLHIACLHGTKAQVIKYLVSINPNATEIKDISGKTPLHLLFDDYKKKIYCIQTDSSRTNRTMTEIVTCLCNSGPRSTISEDENDMSPIEFAIEQEADLKVIRLLQKSALKYRKYHDALVKQNSANIDRNKDQNLHDKIEKSVGDSEKAINEGIKQVEVIYPSMIIGKGKGSHLSGLVRNTSHRIEKKPKMRQMFSPSA